MVLSVGLIPENELSLEAGVELDKTTGGPIVSEYLETTTSGIFACGNGFRSTTLWTTLLQRALEQAKWPQLREKRHSSSLRHRNKAGDNVRYVVPQKISKTEDVEFFLRAARPMDRPTLVVGDSLYTKKMREAKPGEMISVKIPKEKLQSFTGSELTFALREGI